MAKRNPGISWARFQQLIEARGVPFEVQSAFYRLGRGRCVIHVSRRDPVTRVDLKGMDDLASAHRAVTAVSEEQARIGHLGNVRAQLDFSRPDAEVLKAFAAALARVERESQTAEGASRRAPGAVADARFQITLPRETAEAVETICEEMKARVPRGLDVDVTPISTIRVLLNEAIEARRAAPKLTAAEEEGLELALRQVRDGELHDSSSAREVIESVRSRDRSRSSDAAPGYEVGPSRPSASIPGATKKASSS